MSGNRIAHTLLHRARRAAASSSFSSAGRPSSLVSCAEARSSQSSCSSSSRHVHFRRQHAFAFSPSATMRLFNTNSSKDFEDEVKEQNPLQYGRDEGEETTDGWEEDDDLEPEVSSPGAERLLKVPDDLFRFKAMPMQVCYIEDVESRGTENDGVFMLDHVELESDSCIWKLANVREN